MELQKPMRLWDVQPRPAAVPCDFLLFILTTSTFRSLLDIPHVLCSLLPQLRLFYWTVHLPFKGVGVFEAAEL